MEYSSFLNVTMWDEEASQDEAAEHHQPPNGGEEDDGGSADHGLIAGPDLLGYQWKRGNQLGKGTFGKVFEATSATGLVKHPVSIKTEHPQAKKKDLDKESTILGDLQGAPGVAKFYQYMDNRGMDDPHRYLVMQKLGIDLENYRQHCGGSLSEPIVVRLAYQMIQRFQHVHEQPASPKQTPIKKLLFRDTKPNNFMLGWDHDRQQYTDDVYVIDFGLASYYEDPVFKNHMPQTGPNGQRPGFAGTQRYASRNALDRLQQGRRDDMETLGYVWAHLYTGALPWAGMKATLTPEEQKLDGAERERAEKRAKNKLFQQQIKLRNIARDRDWTYDKRDGSEAHMLPPVLKDYLNSVTELEHEDRPEYERYLKMIKDYADDHDIDLNGGFNHELGEDGSAKRALKC